MSPVSRSSEPARIALRYLAAAALVITLLVLILNTGRQGVGSMLNASAARTGALANADQAERYSPTNPETHYVRGSILGATGDLSAAVDEMNQSAAARPEDFALWLSLARIHELNGETDAAIAAARQAIPLAPYYVEPHWQLGNILLRAGENEEAFKELGLAGASNPNLLPGIIGLAWQISNGDVEFVEHSIEPKTPETYLELGKYFRQRKQVDAAIAMLSAAVDAGTKERQSYVGELVQAKQFKTAAALWSVDHKIRVDPGVLINPGFEEESNLNEPGFAWRLDQEPHSFHLSLDPTDPREGRFSLKIDFGGDLEPGQPIFSQLILIEPGVHYRLRFAARSEAIVSGAMPRVNVAEGESAQLLGEPADFPRTTSGWREYAIEFQPGQSATAVEIVVGRQPCDKHPCPIFGRLWLDNFVLEKL
jgi:tetratricopeptide (TPR) repeat protein